MNPYEELLDKYENLKLCRNELLGIVKTVQPNGFLEKAIRRAEALQKSEKNDRVLPLKNRDIDSIGIQRTTLIGN